MASAGLPLKVEAHKESAVFERMQSRIGRLWCTMVHDSPMWPVNGEYECRRCGQRYPAFAEAGVRTRANSAKKPSSTLVFHSRKGLA
jgi:hypothetical protein